MSWVGVGTAVGAVGSAVIGSQSGGGGKSDSGTVQKAIAMDRPAEFATIFNQFMGEYFGLDQGKQRELAEVQRRIDAYKTIPVTSGKRWRTIQRELAPLEARKVSLQQEMEDSASPGFKGLLKTAFDENRAADQKLISTMEAAYAPNTNLLSEIVDKRMTGEAVGPYGADIDKALGDIYTPSPYASDISNLLSERTGISFGGGDPMQFITGSQQRMVGDLLRNSEARDTSQQNLLSSLLAAQETGLGNIEKTSLARALSETMPAQTEHDLFKPSNIADIAYIKDLRSLFEPMEYSRMQATPSVTTGTNASALAPQAAGQGASNVLGNLGQLLNLYGTVKDLAPNSAQPATPSRPSSSSGSGPSFSSGGSYLSV